MVFFDNNVLALPDCPDIFAELADMRVEVDFNQGMDARLVTEETAHMISRVKMPLVRMAFDYSGIRPFVQKAIQHLKTAGVSGRRQVFYVLRNYIDDPQDFFEPVRDHLSWGVVVIPNAI